MTNNINGIDVSECYADNKMMKDGLYCFWEGGNCADNEFCYFKELKRLQKENEELKARLRTLDDEILTIEITPDEFERHKKFKQALEEIREIAEIHQYFNPELLEIKGDIGQMQDLKMTEIFKKCNEVLNDRD